jgi:hypothetical protein
MRLPFLMAGDGIPDSAFRLPTKGGWHEKKPFAVRTYVLRQCFLSQKRRTEEVDVEMLSGAPVEGIVFL